MYKRYINIPQAPNPDIGAKKASYQFKQQIEIIYKLDNTAGEPLLSGHPWGMIKVHLTPKIVFR